MASNAWGQHPPPRGVGVRSPRTTTEPALGPPSAAPPIAAYPLENRNQQWDLITSFSPALTLYVNRPSYQLSAGYSFSADLYAREDRHSNAFDSQNFAATGLYRLTPVVTLTASDTFAYDRNSNRVAAQGFS